MSYIISLYNIFYQYNDRIDRCRLRCPITLYSSISRYYSIICLPKQKHPVSRTRTNRSIYEFYCYCYYYYYYYYYCVRFITRHGRTSTYNILYITLFFSPTPSVHTYPSPMRRPNIIKINRSKSYVFCTTPGVLKRFSGPVLDA